MDDATGPLSKASFDPFEIVRVTGPLLRRPEVERETGLSRSSIYRLIERGVFPRPVRLTSRSVAWPADEIQHWKASLPVTGT